MDLWAIIPVKPFALGKSRLAGVLTPAEREGLNRRLFRRVFDAAGSALGVHRIIVVTADAALRTSTRRAGAVAVAESQGRDLNGALTEACWRAVELGAAGVLVLPSDLPNITGADIVALRDAIGPAPSCVIAPDDAERGTNALALVPPDPTMFCFGPQSFAAHQQAARQRGYNVLIVRRSGLARDLDTPESYRHFAGAIA